MIVQTRAAMLGPVFSGITDLRTMLACTYPRTSNSATLAARFALTGILALASAGSDGAQWLIAGRVVGVSDGDTITLLDFEMQQHKIRLAGIDAPEKKQAFGNRSKQSLSRLVFGLRVEAECSKKDRYRREVCRVVRDGVDVNLEQVRVGMAWWYREYANEQSSEDQVRYQSAEASARAQRLGLWRDTDPVPPWAWRRKAREQSAK